MTEREFKEMYKWEDSRRRTWCDTLMAAALCAGVLGMVVLFGFLLGVGIDLSRGVF